MVFYNGSKEAKLGNTKQAPMWGRLLQKEVQECCTNNATSWMIVFDQVFCVEGGLVVN